MITKFMFLSFIQCGFKTNEIIKTIKGFEGFKNWGIKNTEQIGDRGILFQVKHNDFNGYILIVYTFNDHYEVRKINGFGLSLKINRIKNINDLPIIIDSFYLVD